MRLPHLLALRFIRGVHTVPPDWFCRHVLPAYAESWDGAEAELRDDPYEARRFRELESELAVSGIQRPISICFDHWWSCRPTVDDGMHRVITAVRLGLPIPVSRNYRHPNQHLATDVYRVTATGSTVEDLLTAVVSLTSFRMSSGPWIQTDTAAAVGTHAVEVYLPHHPELRDRIAGELSERLRSSGIDASVEFRCEERTLEAWAAGGPK